MTKHYDVSKDEVMNAWKSVRKSGGACGFDGITIEDVEGDLDNQLYKIWNRMSAGSYMAKSVLLVNIPKAKGGYRQLGIPTVCDRIAQVVVKNRLESILEDKFCQNSYAYRPGKSAIDAVTVCRERCFVHEWLVEIDIKGFFDNIDHDILLDMLLKHTDDKVIVLYAKRFLKATGIESGRNIEIAREKGTPQGGVVSPILANLYLHEAFDNWMQEIHSNIKYERYADDIVVHCCSEKQAYFIKEKVQARLKQYKLELNLEKTKIVYTGIKNDHDHRKHNLPRKFSFLGYDFKPRIWHGKLVYTPGIGTGAMKMIKDKIKKTWQLKVSVSGSLEDIAERVNPVIRGWINYYGHYRRSDLYKLEYVINNYLVRFIKKKYESYATWNKAWKHLGKLKAESAHTFCHWYMISESKGRAV
ncbi:group II intron reverse transcriptase/maturase [Candidatus Tisiphia endosymbiont of Ditula angustiorana]|uniref:group II intron reverse transcriptase/maturase n=1 Tax=Candidatus Tisiphia endosymbiont of Ditula angustiorana TaxID=3066272 RepID=UPI00312C9758